VGVATLQLDGVGAASDPQVASPAQEPQLLLRRTGVGWHPGGRWPALGSFFADHSGELTHINSVI
jgi:hypothetical protein